MGYYTFALSASIHSLFIEKAKALTLPQENENKAEHVNGK